MATFEDVEAAVADTEIAATVAGGAAAAVAEPAAGTRVDRYQLVSLLGAGGMGEVYRARDPELARDVALKLVRPRSGTVASLQARLRREAQAMAKLSHANVVPVFDLGAVDDRLFIAMGLCEDSRAALAAQPGNDDALREIDAWIAAHRGGRGG